LKFLDDGLHTYSDKDYAIMSSKSKQNIFANSIYEAYIPKGTQYYYNSINKEYISEKLIVKPIKINTDEEV
jgi:hypothetical protein